MASVNKVILLGALGHSPEFKEMSNGSSVANLSVATSRRYKDSQGELQEETEWHRVVFFGRQAEIVRDYLQKGDSIYVEGRLRTRTYADKEGVKRRSTEILADFLQLLPKRAKGQEQEKPLPQAASERDDPPF